MVKRTFATTDLSGARITLSCQMDGSALYHMEISAVLFDGIMDNMGSWMGMAPLTALAQVSNDADRLDTEGYSQMPDISTATITIGGITGSYATVAFWFHLTDWDYIDPQHVHIQAIRVTESDGTSKYECSIHGQPITEAAGNRFQIFNNEDQSVYFSTPLVDYSEFYELGADQDQEFRLVNGRGTAISVADLSALGSEGSNVGAWASIRTATPIGVAAGASTVISVRVIASDVSVGDFFFVLRASVKE